MLTRQEYYQQVATLVGLWAVCYHLSGAAVVYGLYCWNEWRWREHRKHNQEEPEHEDRR